MPANIWALEWENLNSQRRFPLAVSASGTDTSGSFTFPNDFLIGIDLPVSTTNNVDPSRFFVQQLGVYFSGFTLLVAYQPEVGDAVTVASAMIPRTGFTANSVYALGGINTFSDTVGKIAVGSLSGMAAKPSGLFTFTLLTAMIEPDCVRPLLRGVSALYVVSGQTRSQPLYGDIELIAQDNIQLVPVIVNGQNPQIRISAVQGEGLAQPCECSGDTQAPPIRRINGIAPTAAGDLTLIGTDCVRFEGIQNGLRVDDTCATPCCGCTELEAVTRDLETLGSKATTVTNFVNRLETAVTSMNQTILGSRLNDNGCA